MAQDNVYAEFKATLNNYRAQGTALSDSALLEAFPEIGSVDRLNEYKKSYLSGLGLGIDANPDGVFKNPLVPTSEVVEKTMTKPTKELSYMDFADPRHGMNLGDNTKRRQDVEAAVDRLPRKPQLDKAVDAYLARANKEKDIYFKPDGTLNQDKIVETMIALSKESKFGFKQDELIYLQSAISSKHNQGLAQKKWADAAHDAVTKAYGEEFKGISSDLENIAYIQKEYDASVAKSNELAEQYKAAAKARQEEISAKYNAKIDKAIKDYKDIGGDLTEGQLFTAAKNIFDKYSEEYAKEAKAASEEEYKKYQDEAAKTRALYLAKVRTPIAIAKRAIELDEKLGKEAQDLFLETYKAEAEKDANKDRETYKAKAFTSVGGRYAGPSSAPMLAGIYTSQGQIGSMLTLLGAKEAGFRMMLGAKANREELGLPSLHTKDYVDLADPLVWMSMITENLPTQVLLALPSWGGSVAGSALAGVAGLGKVGTTALSYFGAISTSTFGNVLMEAGDAYRSAVEMGLGDYEARVIAGKVARADLLTVATQAIKAIPFVGGAIKSTGVFGMLAIEGVGNYFEETYEEWNQKRFVEGSPETFLQYAVTPEGVGAGALGFVMGTMYAAAPQVVKTSDRGIVRDMYNSVLEEMRASGRDKASANRITAAIIEGYKSAGVIDEAKYKSYMKHLDRIDSLKGAFDESLSEERFARAEQLGMEIMELEERMNSVNESTKPVYQSIISKKRAELADVIGGGSPVYALRLANGQILTMSIDEMTQLFGKEALLTDVAGAHNTVMMSAIAQGGIDVLVAGDEKVRQRIMQGVEDFKKGEEARLGKKIDWGKALRPKPKDVKVSEATDALVTMGDTTGFLIKERGKYWLMDVHGDKHLVTDNGDINISEAGVKLEGSLDTFLGDKTPQERKVRLARRKALSNPNSKVKYGDDKVEVGGASFEVVNTESADGKLTSISLRDDNGEVFTVTSEEGLENIGKEIARVTELEAKSKAEAIDKAKENAQNLEDHVLLNEAVYADGMIEAGGRLYELKDGEVIAEDGSVVEVNPSVMKAIEKGIEKSKREEAGKMEFRKEVERVSRVASAKAASGKMEVKNGKVKIGGRNYDVVANEDGVKLVRGDVSVEIKGKKAQDNLRSQLKEEVKPKQDEKQEEAKKGETGKPPTKGEPKGKPKGKLKEKEKKVEPKSDIKESEFKGDTFRKKLKRGKVSGGYIEYGDIREFAEDVGLMDGPFKFLFEYLSGKGISVKVTTKDKIGPGSAGASHSVAYVPGTKKIAKRSINVFTAALDSIVHEAIHAALEISGARYDKKFRDAVHDMRTQVRSWMQEQGSEKVFKSQKPIFAKTLMDYITTKGHPEELITFAFSNKEFAAFLNSIPYKSDKGESSTIWAALKDAILELIGVASGATKTQLDRLNEILDEFAGGLQVVSDKVIDTSGKPMPTHAKDWGRGSFRAISNEDADAIIESSVKSLVPKDDAIGKSSFKIDGRGVSDAFIKNAALSEIGTEEQYREYLSSIFPDSAVRGVVYHGSHTKADVNSAFPDGIIYFADTEDYAKNVGGLKRRFIHAAIVDIKNPLKDTKRPMSDAPQELAEDMYRKGEMLVPRWVKHSGKFNNDGIIGIDYGQQYGSTIVAFSPKQVHVLGSQADIDGFRNFVRGKDKDVIQKLSSGVMSAAEYVRKASIGPKAKRMATEIAKAMADKIRAAKVKNQGLSASLLPGWELAVNSALEVTAQTIIMGGRVIDAVRVGATKLRQAGASSDLVKWYEDNAVSVLTQFAQAAIKTPAKKEGRKKAESKAPMTLEAKALDEALKERMAKEDAHTIMVALHEHNQEKFDIAAAEVSPEEVKDANAKVKRMWESYWDATKKAINPANWPSALQDLWIRYIEDPAGSAKAAFWKHYNEMSKASNNKGIIAAAELVLHKLNVAHGASGAALQKYEEYRKKVFSGLNLKELEKLSTMVRLFRIIEIDGHYGEGAVKHTGDLNATSARAALSAMFNEDKAMYAKLEKRAAEARAFFKELREILFNSGIIKAELNEELAKFQYYSPTLFLDKIDPVTGHYKSMGVGRTREVRSSGIMSIKGGALGAIELDLAKTMADFASRVYGRKFNNDAFVELYKFSQRDDIGYTDSETGEKIGYGVKGIIDESMNPDMTSAERRENAKAISDAKKKYVDRYVEGFVDGKRTYIFFDNPKFSELLDTNVGMAKDFAVIKWLSFTPILKYFATGVNPSFALTNTPRDFFTGYFNTNLTGNPIAYTAMMARAWKNIFWDAVSGGPKWKKAVEQGIRMEFLSEQGMFTSRFMRKAGGGITGRKGDITFGSVNEFFGFINNASERAGRLALRDAFIEKFTKDFKKKNNSAPTGKDLEDIEFRATAEARAVADFAQGGQVALLLDSIFPYSRAATQGVRSYARQWRRHPLQQAEKHIWAVGGFAAAALISRLWSGEDDDDIDPRIKSTHVTIKTSIEGERNGIAGKWVLRIATPHELAPARIVGESLVDMFYSDFWNNVGERLTESRKMLTNVTPLAPDPSSIPSLGVMLALFGGWDLIRMSEIDSRMGEGWSRSRYGDADKAWQNVAERLRDIGIKGYSANELQRAASYVFTSRYTNTYIGIIASVADMWANAGDELVRAEGEMSAAKQAGNLFKSIAGRGAMVVTPKTNIEKAKDVSEKRQTAMNVLSDRISEGADRYTRWVRIMNEDKAHDPAKVVAGIAEARDMMTSAIVDAVGMDAFVAESMVDKMVSGILRGQITKEDGWLFGIRAFPDEQGKAAYIYYQAKRRKLDLATTYQKLGAGLAFGVGVTEETLILVNQLMKSEDPDGIMEGWNIKSESVYNK